MAESVTPIVTVGLVPVDQNAVPSTDEAPTTPAVTPSLQTSMAGPDAGPAVEAPVPNAGASGEVPVSNAGAAGEAPVPNAGAAGEAPVVFVDPNTG